MVEEERRRLRRDLHDGLGPGLATLGMGLDAIGNRAVGTSAEAAVAPVVARLRTQADEMLADLDEWRLINQQQELSVG